MIERTNTASLTLTGGKELKESFCPLHKEHFKEHYAARVPQLEMPPKRAQPENFPHSENVKVTVNEDPPTLEEKEHVLKTFKNNKSAGTGKRKTEGLKYNSSNQLVSISMTQLKLHAIITCLHKKGLFNIAKNLSIRANMSRILAKIVKSRLSMIVHLNVVLNMTVVLDSD